MGKDGRDLLWVRYWDCDVAGLRVLWMVDADAVASCDCNAREGVLFDRGGLPTPTVESSQIGGEGDGKVIVARPVATEAVEERTEKCGMRGCLVGVGLGVFLSMRNSRVASDDRRDPDPTGFRGTLNEDDGWRV